MSDQPEAAAPAKPARKSKSALALEQLQAQLQQLQAANAELTETNRLIARERDGLESSLATEREERAVLQAKLREALQPVAEKTRDWNWPPPEITLWGKLTWGELRQAAEAHSLLSPPSA